MKEALLYEVPPSGGLFVGGEEGILTSPAQEPPAAVGLRHARLRAGALCRVSRGEASHLPPSTKSPPCRVGFLLEKGCGIDRMALRGSEGFVCCHFGGLVLTIHSQSFENDFQMSKRLNVFCVDNSTYQILQLHPQSANGYYSATLKQFNSFKEEVDQAAVKDAVVIIIAMRNVQTDNDFLEKVFSQQKGSKL